MSRPTAVASRTNRRFLLLALGLGVLGAVLVYVAFSRDSGTTRTGGPTDIPVVVARQEIAARTKITASMVELRYVSADAASQLAYSDVQSVVGQVARFPIAANEQILTSKLVAPTTSAGAGRSLSFVVPQGKRAIAIKVSEVVSAGGLVLPGDYVDILVVYDIEFQSSPSDPTSREKAESYFVHTLFQNVEVLAVSQAVVDVVPEATNSSATGQRVRNTEGKPNPEAITVTLALSPADAQKLYLAESNGRIRMTVRAFGDSQEVLLDYMLETELFPRNLPNPFLR
jgi:pilus assembly protein CpaB